VIENVYLNIPSDILENVQDFPVEIVFCERLGGGLELSIWGYLLSQNELRQFVDE